MINIIISLKGLQKISDGLYINLLLPVTGTKVPDKQQVPDEWKDECKLPKLIKFDAISYNI